MEAAQIEKEIIEIIKKMCEGRDIDEVINGDFCPGNYIRSHVLVSIIPEIEIKAEVSIPLGCYIFNDKDNNPLSIKSAVEKLIKETKKVKKEQKKKA